MGQCSVLGCNTWVYQGVLQCTTVYHGVLQCTRAVCSRVYHGVAVCSGMRAVADECSSLTSASPLLTGNPIHLTQCNTMKMKYKYKYK